MLPYHCDHVGKRLSCLRLFPDHHHPSLRDQQTVDLYLDRIRTLSIKIPQREVVLDLLEQQLDHPPLLVDDGDLLRR
jgi:hypothetical protein